MNKFFGLKISTGFRVGILVVSTLVLAVARGWCRYPKPTVVPKLLVQRRFLTLIQ